MRTPVAKWLVRIGALAALAGLVLALLGFAWGKAVAIGGLIIEFSAPGYHDWRHKRRGEQPHAIRPNWLGGPRRG